MNQKTNSPYGPPCNACGGQTIRNGTCWVCINCGTTTGCSRAKKDSDE